MSHIKDGVWVTMLTPFTNENSIDYGAVADMLEWYIAKGVSGIFAVCQSSEMFYLNFKERYELASFITEKVKGRTGIVISGHVEDSMDKQIEELNTMAALKPDALVLVSNRLGTDWGFIDNLKKIESSVKTEIPLGIYECPQPKKRLIKDDELRYMLASERYIFLKDTSCDLEIMKRRINIINKSGFKLFNANSATLLDSLLIGCRGYCGVMANFHPDLYQWLCDYPKDVRARKVSSILSMMSLIEEHAYPYCAKNYMSRFERINITDHCRKEQVKKIPSLGSELEAINILTDMLRKEIFSC